MAKSRSQYSLEILLGAKKASSFQSGINGAKNELEGMSSTAKKVAGLIATAFGAIKIKDFVKESVDTFSDYEQSLANTAAIANATQTEQEQLNEAAREAGKATTKTAQESADALGYMALAGWNVKESTSALQPVLKLSAASNMDLATCSDLVTDSMSALKLQVKDLPEYLDMVTKAQNSSNMNSQQMMEAYIKAGGAARTLGVSAKDTGVALGILANNGTSTASDFINNSKNKITYSTPIGPAQQKKGSSGGNSKKTTIKAKKNAKGGIYKNPVISMLAEKDSEAVIPLNSSPRSKALYQRTGELLGMSFTDDNTSYKQRRDVRLYNAVKRSPSMGGEKINITCSTTLTTPPAFT